MNTYTVTIADCDHPEQSGDYLYIVHATDPHEAEELAVEQFAGEPWTPNILSVRPGLPHPREGHANDCRT